ncbi:hypothetical protein [Dolosicoccus paucivorans]
MSINYKTIPRYRNQLKTFQSTLKDKTVFETEALEQILQNKTAIAKKQVEDLPASYAPVLEESRLTQDDLIFRIAPVTFPLSKEDELNNELLEYILAKRAFARKLFE